MTDTRELELWRIVNKAFQNSIEKFGDIFAKDVTRDLLANGVTVQGDKDTNVPSWIPVTERLPDKHDRYLCNVKAFSFPDLRYFAILKYDDGGFIEGKIYTDDVTHWMPLPEPPKGE